MLGSIPAAASPEGGADCVPVRSVKEADLAFKPGERMSFVMGYRWGIINADIGTADCALDMAPAGGENIFHCTVTGRTNRGWDVFFKVREEFHSWFKADGLVPVRFTRDTHEGDYVAKNEYNYVWASEKPYIDAQTYSSSHGEKNLQIPLTHCTFDLPALFFYARNIDISKVGLNVKHPMMFAVDDEVYHVYFIYKGKVVKDVPGLGRVKCMRFAAKLLAGEVFKGEHDMDLYISDDMNRIPVYFSAPIRVGIVEGRLTGVKGLKYDFSAKLD